MDKTIKAIKCKKPTWVHFHGPKIHGSCDIVSLQLSPGSEITIEYNKAIINQWSATCYDVTLKKDRI